MLIDLWVGTQTWLFETLVSPALYALNLMEWYEAAFNAVEFVMLGLVQIAVIALVMRPIERPMCGCSATVYGASANVLSNGTRRCTSMNS